MFYVIKELMPYVTKDMELKSLNMLSNTRASTLLSAPPTLTVTVVPVVSRVDVT